MSRKYHMGRESRFTATEIERVRQAWDALQAAHAQRRALQRELGMKSSEFKAYGRRDLGKKPRQPLAKQRPDTIDWVSADRRTEP